MSKPYDKSQWDSLVIAEWVAGKDQRTIAKTVGCTLRTVGDYIKDHATPQHMVERARNIGVRKTGYYSKYRKLQNLRPMLTEMWKQKYSIESIANTIGISERSVREYMNDLGIRKIKKRPKAVVARLPFRSFDPLQIRALLKNLGVGSNV